MMSKSNKYKMDELLKQRLKDASAPVPEGMWSRIVDARKDRRVHPYGWAGFGALVLITAAFAGWMAYGEFKANQPEAIQVASVANSASSSDVYNAATSQGQYDKSDVMTTSDLDAANESSSSAQGENAAAQSDDASTINTRNAANSSKKSNTARNNASNQKATSSDQLESKIEEGNDEAMIQDEFSSDLFATVQSNQKLGMPQHLSNSGMIHETSSMDKGRYAEFYPGVLKLGGSKKGSPNCYSFNSFLRGLSIDAYMAPEYAARQLVYKEPGMIDYAALRNETESYSFAFSMGFRANAHFKGGLALRTGLIYTDIVEKLQFRDPNAETTKVITINIDTLYDGPNQIIRIDTLSIVEYGQQDKVGYNRYRFFDVPLILAYEIDRGRWIIHLNTGVMLNIATAQRGSLLDPESNLVSINSNGVNSYPAFRKKVGSSLLMSLGFNYALKPKLHLLIEPQLRVWMSPLNIKDYPVDQKYVNVGLAMGVRQYF
jgi:hypothetical protein